MAGLDEAGLGEAYPALAGWADGLDAVGSLAVGQVLFRLASQPWFHRSLRPVAVWLQALSLLRIPI